MNQQSFRGVMKGQSLVILETPVPLPDGTPVQVTSVASEVRSAAAVLAAMDAEPHLSPDDVAELEEAIASRRRPRVTLELISNLPTFKLG
jgi:hypothetical protein